MRVSIFGMGKLGASFAAALASKGHEVVGVDVDRDIVAQINNAEAPFPETDLQEHLDQYSNSIRATEDGQQAVRNTELTLVFVPTPSTESGRFDNSYVYAALEEIAVALDGEDYHLISVASTVSPGSMREFERYLEDETGLQCGRDFGLCYSPAFIAQGSVIRDFLNPEIVIIGESDETSGKQLLELLGSTIETEPVTTRMNYINAEIAKITFNVFSTMKISFANQMSMICGGYEGANVDTVMESIIHDARIGGTELFSGGLGYGGPCLPRDNDAFREAAALPEKLDIQRVVDNVNESVPELVVQGVSKRIGKEDVVGVLGLSYKPGTKMTRCSQSLAIADALESNGYDVRSYDPMATERTEDRLSAVLESTDVLLILTPWEEFRDIQRQHLEEKTIFDIWRLYRSEFRDKTDYYAWGIDFPSAVDEQDTEDRFAKFIED